MPTDNTNRAIQGNVAIQVTQHELLPMCNFSKWHHLIANFGTNASGATNGGPIFKHRLVAIFVMNSSDATCWSNLEPI